VTLLEFDEYVG